jgi:phage/plasmid-like protein (TIGR03299 family)
MAANLGFGTHGKVGMVYTGAAPWHKDGQEALGLMTTTEACDFVGMPEMMELASEYTLDGQIYRVPDKKIIVRKDTKEYISTVGDGYTVVQFREAFQEMGDELIGAGGAHIETAGILGNGSKGWLMARLPGDIVVDGTKGKDSIRRYLLIYTAHDGTAKLSVITSPVRTVCENTVRAAFAEMDAGSVSIRHSKNAKVQMSKASATLAAANEHYAKFAESINLFASKGTSEDTVREYLMNLIPDKADAKHKTRSENIRAEIANLAVNGKGQDMEGVKGTVWALYNGVTEYVDHSRGTRGDSDAVRAENRLESVWFGSGAQLKDKAFNLALAMAK